MVVVNDNPQRNPGPELDRLRPPSLHPLSVEDALAGAMQAPAPKARKSKKQRKAKRPKRKKG